MANAPIIGDMVHYLRYGVMHAAIITKPYPDNAADLFVIPAYSEVGSQVAQVAQSDNEEEGFFFYPKATKSAGASTPKQNAAEHAEHKKH